MTRDEIAAIIMYCKEHKITYKSRLANLNISVWRFYDSKSRYTVEQPFGNISKGDFIEPGKNTIEQSVIETFNDEVKNMAQVEHSRQRSFKNFIGS